MSQKERIYMCIDMKSFYVNVNEEVSHALMNF